MRFLLLPLLVLVACSAPVDLLGGQEGEPLGGQEGEPMAPPPAEPDPGFDNDGGMPCVVEVSCEGPGWCADYAEGTVPADFIQACLEAGGTPSNEPCDPEGNAGFCQGQDDEVGDCTVVYIYDDFEGDVQDFCDELDFGFVSPRG